MNPFLLNTASRSNRLGCAFPSDLERTVKSVLPEDRAALLESVNAELIKVNAKLAKLSDEMRVHGYKRGTRTGAAWGARYNRAAHKQSQLEEAARKLSA